MNIDLNIQVACISFYISGISENNAIAQFTESIRKLYNDVNNEIAKNRLLQTLIMPSHVAVSNDTTPVKILQREPELPLPPQLPPQFEPQLLSQLPLQFETQLPLQFEPSFEPQFENEPSCDILQNKRKSDYNNDQPYPKKQYITKYELWIKFPYTFVDKNYSMEKIHSFISNLIKSECYIRPLNIFVPPYDKSRHCYVGFNDEKDMEYVRYKLHNLKWMGGNLIVNYNKNNK